MKKTRSINGSRVLGVPGAILLLVALVLLPGPALETASSVFGSVLHPTQRSNLLVRRLNSPANSAHSQPTNQLQVSAAYNSLPLYFEANRGQTEPQVKFVSRGSGYTLFLTPRGETVLVLRKPSPKRDLLKPAALVSMPAVLNPDAVGPPAIVRMKLVGGNPRPRVEALDELSGKANYLIGNDRKKWRTNVPLYGKVRYREVYPGVDLVYYGNQRQVEHDFIVAPGADPRSITLNLAGAEKLSLDPQGALVLAVKDGELRLDKPRIYQEVDGARREISGDYVLKNAHQVSFQIAGYDVSKPLVIDPTLFYSTYLGGSSDDFGFGIAVDSAGNAYVTGNTCSTDFPTTPGAFQPANASAGCIDAFVTKLNPTGSAPLVYSTYLGGSNADNGTGIAVDSAGNAYVTGFTDSTDFPTTPGAFQPTDPTIGNNTHAFVTKLNPTGSAPLYSTYLGGSSDDLAYGIAVDSAGNAYVTGYTCSTNFPTTLLAFQTTNASGGCENAFVTKLNPTGSAPLYSTYLGGSSVDQGFGIAVDSAGNAYVTGFTFSTDFPTTPGAFQPTDPTIGNNHAFVTKLNPTGSAPLVYSTYLGGSADDVGSGIVVDSAGNAYVTGYTCSTNFPTTPGAFQPANASAGCIDAFVTKLNPTGSAPLVYSTYLGGSNLDYALGIAVDSAGNAYVTGFTTSTNFPTTTGAIQTVNRGGVDAFVTALNPLGTAPLVYSTYLGGSADDVGRGIAVDSASNAYVTGNTDSGNFPTTAGAFQTGPQGSYDAFVAKIIAIVMPPSPTVGKVTGGGTVNVSGGIGNFGFIVQRQAADNSINGDLQYVNHASGTKIHSVMFTTFTISGNTATFGGTCTNNGAPCIFNVTVQDNDQTSGPDSFIISINGGAPEGGTLRGGDIEIHQ
jgi:Beta-propeller repeat